MKIAFILMDDNKHNGGARPIITFGKYMKDSKVISFNEKLKISSENFHSVSSLEEAEDIVGDVDYIFIDDKRIKTGLKLKKRARVPMIVYAQILFGFHSLGIDSHFDSLGVKLEYGISRLIPFRILTYNYRKMLSSSNLLISNSSAMSTLLNFVYGFPDNYVVFPPVDTSVFRNLSIYKDSILVFLGRRGDLNEYRAIDILNQLAQEKKLFLQIFGTDELPKNTIVTKNMIINKNLTDNELINLYCRSFVTVCIQKQEFFGYVPVESLACGTPSLTLYFHEAIYKTDNELKVIRKTTLNELKNDVCEILNYGIDRNIIETCIMTGNNFSGQTISQNLIDLLKEIGDD